MNLLSLYPACIATCTKLRRVFFKKRLVSESVLSLLISVIGSYWTIQSCIGIEETDSTKWLEKRRALMESTLMLWNWRNNVFDETSFPDFGRLFFVGDGNTFIGKSFAEAILMKLQSCIYFCGQVLTFWSSWSKRSVANNRVSSIPWKPWISNNPLPRTQKTRKICFFFYFYGDPEICFFLPVN